MKIKLVKPSEKAQNNYEWIIKRLAGELGERCGHNEIEQIMLELGCDAMNKGIYEEPEIHNALIILHDEALI